MLNLESPRPALFSRDLALVWPSLTLLAGVLCGTSLWSAEQSAGSRRFLVDQRLPLSVLWLIKTALGLLATLLIAFVLLLTATAVGGLAHLLEADAVRDLLGRSGPRPIFREWIWGVMLVWLAHGFSTGALLDDPETMAMMLLFTAPVAEVAGTPERAGRQYSHRISEPRRAR